MSGRRKQSPPPRGNSGPARQCTSPDEGMNTVSLGFRSTPQTAPKRPQDCPQEASERPLTRSQRTSGER
eukprot:8021704-Pyramimonas_sp.AAC.1